MHQFAIKIHALLMIKFPEQLTPPNEDLPLPLLEVRVPGIKYPVVRVTFEESRWKRGKTDDERVPIAVHVQYSSTSRDVNIRYAINADGNINEQKFVERIHEGLKAIEEKRGSLLREEEQRNELKRQAQMLEEELKAAGFEPKLAGVYRQERDGVAVYSGSINFSGVSLGTLLTLLTVKTSREGSAS